MTTIIGVDFSGHQEDRNTWMASGKLTDEGALLLDSVQPVRRDDLYDFLMTDVSAPAVVALDFPFSLPRPFLDSLGVHTNTMECVWPITRRISLDQYKARCKNYGTHPKRTGDKCYRVSMSALNTRLVPMTYYGMRMLHKLTTTCPSRWWIPPRDFGRAPDDRITLLEVMPGAFLSSIGLEYKTVKGYKSDLNVRDIVINRLSAYTQAKLESTNVDRYRPGFRANDDCLDSVIAAVSAAMWVMDQKAFHLPEDHRDCAVVDAAKLEGWIYVPRRGGFDGSA